MNALQEVLTAKAAFAEPANVIRDVPFELAAVRPRGLPHSLYEELWHLDFWLQFSLALVRGEHPALPAHSSGSWPVDNDALDEASWQGLLERVRAGLDAASALAGDERELERSFRPGQTVGGELTVVAAHNAYHLGRMVTLRQLLGIWPAELGDSW